MKSLARSAAAVAAAAVLALGLAGCRTSPGAAALVGDERISTEALQHDVAKALSDPEAEAALGSDRPGFIRTQLGRLIQNIIIAAAAAEHDITVTPTEVETQLNEFAAQAGGLPQLQQQAAQSGISKDQLPSYIRFYVLEQKLGDALVADIPVSEDELRTAYEQNIGQFDQVHAAHILVEDKKTADMILRKVRANPAQFNGLAAQYSTDTSNKDQGGDLGTQPQSQFVPSFGKAVFAAKPGSFLEVHTRFGWHVVHVITHQTQSLRQVADQLKSSVLQNKRDQLLAETLKAEAARLGVHVNPRYGRWDAAQGTVVPLGAGRGVVSASPSPAG